jgi:biotin carboxyl carrier protein
MSGNRYTVSIHGRSYEVEVCGRRGNTLTFRVEDQEFSVEVSPVRGATRGSQAPSDRPRAGQRESGSKEVRAPMPGIVSEVKTTVGARVEMGDTLLVIEAMKMENPIKATRGGTIQQIHVSNGQEVLSGTQLITLE